MSDRPARMSSNALPADRQPFSDRPVWRLGGCGWCAAAAICGGASPIGGRLRCQSTAASSGGACSGDGARTRSDKGEVRNGPSHCSRELRIDVDIRRFVGATRARRPSRRPRRCTSGASVARVSYRDCPANCFMNASCRCVISSGVRSSLCVAIVHVYPCGSVNVPERSPQN